MSKYVKGKMNEQTNKRPNEGNRGRGEREREGGTLGERGKA